MQLDRLLRDATESPEGTSQRSQHIELTRRLNAIHGTHAAITYKGVSKWFERGSVPSRWLMRIAALPKKPLNLADYA
jgi:hypothetical protein